MTMLLHDFLCEDFRLLTRDGYGNWITGGVDELMADVDSEKMILKQSPRGRDTQQSLTIYPFVEDQDRKDFYIEIYADHSARIRETYDGEAIPVLRFLLSRWPAYVSFQIENRGQTFAEVAKAEPLRLRNHHEWFHGTTTRHLPEILRLGLMPRDVNQRNYRGMGGSEQGLVYLASEADQSAEHAKNAARKFGGAPVVLQIDLTGLGDRVVNDHDVRVTTLGRDDPFARNYDINDVTTKRVRSTPGEASFLTLGTIAFKGRIPPNRIKVIWQGAEKKGQMEAKSEMFAFVDGLAAVAKQLSKDQLYDFFRMIALRPSGWHYGRTVFADRYYTEPEKTLNSVFATKSQPAQFARWVRGMKIRSGRIRLKVQGGYASPQETEIIRLIDAMASGGPS